MCTIVGIITNMKYLRIKLDQKTIDGDDGTVSGYASVFGNKDSYGDVVEAGAFDRTLGEKDIKQVKMLWQHNSSMPIGVWESSQIDNFGLRLTGRLLIEQNVPKADEAYTLLKAGVVDGLSIGFIPKLEEWDSENRVNRIKDVDLFETSLVTFPANDLSRITDIKSADELATHKRRVEGILREAGYSKKEALDIVMNGVKAELESNGREAQEIAELVASAKAFAEKVKSI